MFSTLSSDHFSAFPTILEPGKGDPPQAALIHQLLTHYLLAPEDWQEAAPHTRQPILEAASREHACELLKASGLLTPLQAERIAVGNDFGLIMGPYRILERLGAGGMGVVFKAEHITLRRPVAIKVVADLGLKESSLVKRFMAEIRTVARLQHPNVVTAIDSGVLRGREPSQQDLHYFVMEYIPGRDLEAQVLEDGPVQAQEVCGLIYQICGALAEAHRQGLIHRDIKPSNILVTPHGHAKLLDFGLARTPRHDRLTQPGVLLGTLSFMGPEQIQDATAVDGRADIYALGTTLFWCLTGREPFPSAGDTLQALAQRAQKPTPRLRSDRPDLPQGLDQVLGRMMEPVPKDRYQTVQQVMKALLPFVQTESGPSSLFDGSSESLPARTSITSRSANVELPRVLIVDDEPELRQFCQLALQSNGFECVEVSCGQDALDLLQRTSFDAVLLDLQMHGMSGLEVLRQLYPEPASPHLEVIVMSGWSNDEAVTQVLAAGAVDFLAKPMSVRQLVGRVKAAVRSKQLREQIAQQAELLRCCSGQLDQLRDDCRQQRDALLLGIGRLGELHNQEPVGQAARVRRYCRAMFAGIGPRRRVGQQTIDQDFCDRLIAVAPLYDIGKLQLPPHILHKPNQLAADERAFMESHTLLGAELIDQLLRAGCLPNELARIAQAVTRHHHERFDGTGYPDGLVGEAIPLAARVICLPDVYDALRSKRSYRPGMTHSAAISVMRTMHGAFDPELFALFEQSADAFDAIFSSQDPWTNSDDPPRISKLRRRSKTRMGALTAPNH